jgi:hypothetical protein
MVVFVVLSVLCIAALIPYVLWTVASAYMVRNRLKRVEGTRTRDDLALEKLAHELEETETRLHHEEVHEVSADEEQPT